LYGLGTTIGAGIYVLVGVAAGHAGLYAPVAFIIAALGIAPTALAYAELSGRLPVSAGEAAYARSGFRSEWIALLTGGLVIVSGLVSSATISVGCAGYLKTFVDFPDTVLVIAVVVLMGVAAIWGIMESVLLAALFTLIEAGGLIILIIYGFSSDLVDLHRLPEMIPPLNGFPLWLGIFNAGLMAIFAFVGFEDLVNVAEETKNPARNMPKAIFLTLGITTVLYALVTIVAVLAIPPAELVASEAPLSLVFSTLTGGSPIIISGIAIFATANTILVQFIMVSRVIYGMAKQGKYTGILAKINPLTRTPLIATVLVGAVTLILALTFPLVRLAELTSQVILLVWILVNTALVGIKLRKDPAPDNCFITPVWIPVSGAVICGALVVLSFFA
jgi:amino acid transporter